MIGFTGGPADGVTLALRRAPILLRVVCRPAPLLRKAGGRGFGTRGESAYEWNALDQPADVAEADEKIFLYRLTARAGSLHLCIRGKNKPAGGWYALGNYEYLEDQPADEILRDNLEYRAWCAANWEQLKPDWKRTPAADAGGAPLESQQRRTAQDTAQGPPPDE